MVGMATHIEVEKPPSRGKAVRVRISSGWQEYITH